MVFDPEQLGQQQRELGATLRKLRKQAGLTGDRLSARCGISQSQISKIETGKKVPSALQVEQILRALGAPAAVVKEVSTLARMARSEFHDYRSSLRRGLHHRQRELAAIESEAAELRYFLPVMLTGLLHTPEYARASLASTPGNHSQAVAKRLERQQILYEENKNFHFLMTEAALSWPLCPPSQMAVQMGRLVYLSELSNLRLGVLSFTGAIIPELPLNTFTIYDNHLATAETMTGLMMMRDPRDIEFHLETFKFFEERALFGDDARDVLTRKAQEYRSHA